MIKITLLIMLAFLYSNLFSQNCSGAVLPPTTINGINVTSTFSGDVSVYPNSWSDATCPYTTPANAIYVGQTSSFSYTFNFSSTINYLYIVITGTGGGTAASGGVSGDEVFTFTTDNGVPTITDQGSCDARINGNVLSSGLNRPSGDGGGGEFVISTCSGFTSLTITGPGGDTGSLIALCQNSINNDGINLIGNDTTTCANNFIPFVKTSPTYASYQWSDAQGNLLSNLQSYTILDSGTYILQTVGGVGQCDDIDTLTVAFYPTTIVSSGADITLNCTLNNAVFTANGNGVHSWETPNNTIVPDPVPISYADTEGDYILSTTDTYGCVYSDTSVLVIDTIAPIIQAGIDTLLTCTRTTIVLDGNDLGNNFTYSWSSNDGNILSGNNSNTSTIDETGIYYYAITNNNNGCTSLDSLTVTIDSVKPVISAGQDTTFTCVPAVINLNGVLDNPDNYLINWTSPDGNIVANENTLNPSINAGGQYVLNVTNLVNGCISTSLVNAFKDDTVSVSILLNNLDVELIDIQALEEQQFSYLGSHGSVIWYVNNTVVSSDSVINYSFDESSVISISLTNSSNGCIAYDTIGLNVNYKFLIPNAISPNEDGLNDFFVIKSLKSFDDNSLVIFNRWGDIVFEAAPYENNWNGQSNSQLILTGGKVSDGTYFYILKLTDNNQESIYKGNIELRRK